jgi:phosphatidylserine/phosphatidylglycerophosphate/cardiolipin synthase-like enzyme
MSLNLNIKIKIQKYFQDYLLTHSNKCRIYELLHNYRGEASVSEMEIRNVYTNSLKTGNLRIINQSNSENDEYSTFVELSCPFPSIAKNDEITVVISSPRTKELSFANLKKRNELMDIRDCFIYIIESAKKELRICSPFMEKNIINVFPEFKTLIANLLNRGVSITILSRELFGKRANKLDWIVEIAKQTGNLELLKVIDYHHTDADTDRVFSSTHAKLLIADQDIAYLGSAELRQNSLSANFEVGCMIKGDSVHEICETFDYMISCGEVWK